MATAKGLQVCKSATTSPHLTSSRFEAMSWQLALESQSQPAESPLLLLPGSAQVGRGQTAIIRSTHQSHVMDFSELRLFVNPASVAANT